MPAKKSTTSSSVTLNGESDRILLTKAITNLVSNRDHFTEAIDSFNQISKDMIVDLDLQIEDRRKELEESKTNIENELKNAKIKADQELSEYKRQAAINILEENGEEPIDSDELEELRNAEETFKEKHNEELEALRKDLTDKAKVELHSALNSQDLRHKAAFAETQAENNMLKKEIECLTNMISKLKSEIDAQRELSATIAQSNSKESIHQNFGKQ